MKELTTEQAAPAFLNVQVTAIPKIDGKGNVSYDTTFTPDRLTVTTPDTVINYQLVDPTPADVKFKKLSVVPDENDQFSVPSISESGKLVTFSDANTAKATFQIKIKFTNKDQQEFLVDPEVDNDPHKAPEEGQIAMLECEPEPDNDPHK